MYQAHYPPEIIDPVGVIERHVPALRLWRETAQEKDPGIRRKKRFERMGFHGH